MIGSTRNRKKKVSEHALLEVTYTYEYKMKERSELDLGSLL